MSDLELSSMTRDQLAEYAEKIGAQLELGSSIDPATAIMLAWKLIEIVRELARRR